jgi:Zn-dependent peptidase ImmA (M78 family)
VTPAKRRDIRRKAELLLQEVGITKAPVDVYRIAKHLDIKIVDAPNVDGFSGFLHRPVGGKATIGVNRSDNPRRQAFTIAHEIGHFLLHDSEQVHVDKAGGVSIMLRNTASSSGTDEKEIQANQFAAEVLMPKTFLSKDIDAFESLGLIEEEQVKRLAGKYAVSIQAMSIRIDSLST